MKIDRPIAISVTIFIIVLLIYFFVTPKYFEFKDLQVKLGKAEAEYNGKFAYYSEISKIFRELEDRKEGLEKIENAIPPNPQLADLVYFFQQKGIESGLIIRSIILNKVSPVTPENNIKEIVFSLDAMGNYQSFKNFLSFLERSSRLFEVSNVSFGLETSSQSPEEALAVQPLASQTYSFTLEIKTHSY